MVKRLPYGLVFRPDYCPTGGPADLATAAFSKALVKLGVEHKLLRAKDWNGDLGAWAVVNGWIKKMLDGPSMGPNRNQVIRAHREAGVNVLCIERGYLGDRAEWHGISWNGFCSTGGDFRIDPDGQPRDRWDMLCDRIGVQLEQRGPCPDSAAPILLCAQVPWDAQVDQGNHLEWLEGTAEMIRCCTDRPILFRPHPKAYRRQDPYAGLSARFRKLCGIAGSVDQPTTRFEDDLANCSALVCFNSNVATLGILSGVPTYTASDSNADPLAFRMDTGELAHIDSPPWPPPLQEREQWAWDLAYKQWHTDEMEAAWNHLSF